MEYIFRSTRTEGSPPKHIYQKKTFNGHTSRIGEKKAERSPELGDVTVNKNPEMTGNLNIVAMKQT